MIAPKAYEQLSDRAVFYAVLNWGLGHATRSIPIIRRLIDQGNQVHIASDGLALALLRREFPNLAALELPAYDIQYDSHNMVWAMLRQTPKLLWAISREGSITRAYVEKHRLDYIISDSRFGCRRSGTDSAFIAHQINIPVSNALAAMIGTYVNKWWIKNFDQLWIPDWEGHQLSGRLSETKDLERVEYIGPLSRLKHQATDVQYDLAVIISGPEPERTRFEDQLMRKLSNTQKRIWIARGTDQTIKNSISNPNVEIVDMANSKAIESAINASAVVLCRSGYSSIMDLAILKKPAIMIPTPGQPEQEYLAQHLSQNEYGWSFYQDLADVDLA